MRRLWSAKGETGRKASGRFGSSLLLSIEERKEDADSKLSPDVAARNVALRPTQQVSTY